MSARSSQQTEVDSETGRRGIDTRETDSEGAAPAGPSCFQCEAPVECVGIAAGECGWSEDGAMSRGAGKRTIIERVHCPTCGAGGSRIKLAEDDRVVGRYGPATRALRGMITRSPVQSSEPSTSARDRARGSADAKMLAGWSE